MEERARRFAAEGTLKKGSQKDHFVFLDGEHLGSLLMRHFGTEPDPGSYDRVGRLRITVERLEE